MIAHQITLQLARTGRFEISYAFINTAAAEIPAQASVEVAELRKAGVRFLDPVIVSDRPTATTSLYARVHSLLTNRPDRYLVGTDEGAKLQSAIQGTQPDIVLTIWAEIATNLVSTFPIKHRVTYAGNPDHKVLDGRLELAERLGDVAPSERLRNLMRRWVTKKAHLQVTRRFDLMWNVAANDAADYRREGIKARYLQNMWPAAVTKDWAAERDASEQLEPLKIVGNVGNLSATGNSFGLLTLATAIVPELRRILGEDRFEVHLFGGGTPHPAVEPLLADKHVKVRGFVDDLDAEILSAPIFLVANNSHRFKVGHTRFLHAWSLGAAVVGFADSAEAMPEIIDGHNAMLGKSAIEVAQCIADLARDPQKRRLIAENGAITLRDRFAPRLVTEQILADIDKLAATSNR